MNISVYQLPNRVQVTREIPLERWMPLFQPSPWLLSKASCEDMEYHGNGVFIVTVKDLGESLEEVFAHAEACVESHVSRLEIFAADIQRLSKGVRLLPGFVRYPVNTYIARADSGMREYWILSQEKGRENLFRYPRFTAIAVIRVWGTSGVPDDDENPAEVFDSELQAHEWWSSGGLDIWETT